MSVASEISRIQTDRNTIRTALIQWGLAESTDNLDDLADIISAIVNRGAVSASVKEGQTYVIPAGYHNGSGVVTGISGGGNYDLQEKTVTPTTSQQEVEPDNGKYGLSKVTVNAIPSAYQDVSDVTAQDSDVLANKVFVDASGNTVVGIIPINGAISLTFNPVSQSTVNIPAGYTTGGTVTLTSDLETALAAI